jgi:hypothetical protein
MIAEPKKWFRQDAHESDDIVKIVKIVNIVNIVKSCKLVVRNSFRSVRVSIYIFVDVLSLN